MEENATITVRLSNGMLVRIPFNNYKETIEKMEKALEEKQEKKKEEEPKEEPQPKSFDVQAKIEETCKRLGLKCRTITHAENHAVAEFVNPPKKK